MKLALVTIGCLLAIGAAPVAHADDDDTAYLGALQSVNVPANSPAMATSYGRGMCERLATVGFDPLVATVHTDNASAGVSTRQAALIIGAAISNYCLDEIPLLPKTLTY